MVRILVGFYFDLNYTMKKLILTSLVLGIFISSSCLAQQVAGIEQVPLKKWKVTKFNFGLGVDYDRYESMSLDHLMNFAQNPNEMKRDLQHLEEEVSTTTAGLALYASWSISPWSTTKNSYRNDREWRFGIGIHSPKEAMVSFKNKDMDTSIVYCNIHGEITLEGAYIRKGKWGKRFHWYWGAGVNIGATFGNQMVLISGKYFEPGEHPSTQESNENSIEKYDAKSVAYTRLYIPYGVHYSIGKKWLLGFDFRSGIGMQKIQGEDVNFIRKTGLFSIGAQYILD